MLDLSDCPEDFGKPPIAQRIPLHCFRTAQEYHRPFEQKLTERARAPGNFSGKTIWTFQLCWHQLSFCIHDQYRSKSKRSPVLQCVSMPIHCQATRSEAPQEANHRTRLERTSSSMASFQENRLHVSSYFPPYQPLGFFLERHGHPLDSACMVSVRGVYVASGCV